MRSGVADQECGGSAGQKGAHRLIEIFSSMLMGLLWTNSTYENGETRFLNAWEPQVFGLRAAETAEVVHMH